MESINASQLLHQLRATAQLASSGSTMTTTQSSGSDFSSMLKGAIDQVNEVQQEAGRMKTAATLNDPNVSLAEVMVSLQKADISFQAMVQVRNKLVDAYRDVMNMPI